MPRALLLETKKTSLHISIPNEVTQIFFQRFDAADQRRAEFLHGGVHRAEGRGGAHRVQGLEGGGELSEATQATRATQATQATRAHSAATRGLTQANTQVQPPTSTGVSTATSQY